MTFRWSPRTPTTGYLLCNPSGCAEVSQLKILLIVDLGDFLKI